MKKELLAVETSVGTLTERTRWLLMILGGVLFCVGIIWLNLDQFYVNWSQELRLNSLSLKYRDLDRRFRTPPAVVGESKRRLPHCIIIGARKCGTRALLEFLNLHPLIRTARYELHFFDSNSTFEKGLDWYREQMPVSRPSQLTIEKTPGYFTSSLAPGRVRAMNPDTKLLLIVRDPVTRTISDYTQVHFTKLAKNKTHDSFESLVFNQRNPNDLNLDYKPVRNSLYVKHMRRWLTQFPRSNFHLVDGDRFVANPIAELQDVERFLELPPLIQPHQLYFNHTKGFFCYRPTGRDQVPRCLGDTKGRPHVQVAPEVKERLRAQFRPFNEKFFLVVNQRFDW